MHVNLMSVVERDTESTRNSIGHGERTIAGRRSKEEQYTQCAYIEVWRERHLYARAHRTNSLTSVVGSLVVSTLPPTCCGKSLFQHHPTERVVSLRLSPQTSSILLVVYVYIALYSTHTRRYIHRSRDERNARTSLTHTRESFIRRAPQKVHKPSSFTSISSTVASSVVAPRRWVNHQQRMCPTC